jgi:transposase-like protein
MSKINNLKKHLSNNTDDSDIGDLILSFFHKEFSNEDYLHVLRQERWKFGIHCPFCQSGNITKQSVSENHVFKYLCLDCNAVFEDDTGSPLSSSTIPLQIWIQCWYLSQYCNSLQYIADKLNLDLNTIVTMLRGMQHLFQTEAVLLKTNDSINSVNSEILNKKNLIEETFKKFLILGGDTGKQPLDTAEYRRQKTIKHSNKDIKKKPNM